MAKSKTARQRHLSWELFERRVQQGPPSQETLHGEPRAVIYITPGGEQIGLRVFCMADPLPPSILAEVGIRRASEGEKSVVEVYTSNLDLYREFYAFCCNIADRIQLDGVEPAAAIEGALRSWASLLRRKPLLSEEKQVGLLGEIWVLRRLAETIDWKAAADAWRGPEAEEHDFTLARIDIEVKTTRQEKRIHTIGSLTQLLPKAGRPLYILSIQLTRAVESRDSLSLPRTIARVLEDARKVGVAIARSIEAQLERQGWRDEDAPRYPQEWQLRTPPALVAVDDGCPAIVPAVLRSLGANRLGRIGRVTYDVNLEEIGVLAGSKTFSTLIRSGTR